MIRISGPELVAVFIDKETDKQIIFFGDEHHSKKGLCYSCKKDKDCFDLVDFINNISIPCDVFIESTWVQHQEKQKYLAHKVSKNNDILDILSGNFRKELYAHQPIIHGKRFHYTDIRKEPNVFELYNVSYVIHHKLHNELIYILNTIYDFKTPKHFVDYADACILSDNFPKSIINIFGKRDAKFYLDKKCINFSTKQKTEEHSSYKETNSQVG
jgi:hypothetical protein